jgi:RNA polymerase sigma-70 factor, ECF subfamily
LPSIDTLDRELEVELLTRIGWGDRDSFETLYDRFSGVLFLAAARILNDQREAEDVVQEVFLQIWDRAHQYNPERGKPLAWAMTLLRNKAIDRIRSTRRRSLLRDQVEREVKLMEDTFHRDCADEIDVLEKNRILRSAISKLPKDQREAIELAFFSGLTQNEIAQRLGEPLGTIKARIRRGMDRLRNIVRL